MTDHENIVYAVLDDVFFRRFLFLRLLLDRRCLGRRRFRVGIARQRRIVRVAGYGNVFCDRNHRCGVKRHFLHRRRRGLVENHPCRNDENERVDHKNRRDHENLGSFQTAVPTPDFLLFSDRFVQKRFVVVIPCDVFRVAVGIIHRNIFIGFVGFLIGIILHHTQ